MISKIERFACDACGRVVAGDRFPGGWRRYPIGWLHFDDHRYHGSALVCSAICAERYDKENSMPAEAPARIEP